VIGWYRGRFEWDRRFGPSLYHCDRRDEMKEIVNTKINSRAVRLCSGGYGRARPEYFTTPNLDKQYPPRYMLMFQIF